jgi:uncharacterized protein YqeY
MQADLKDAMKARETSRVTVLRATLAAIANAEAVESDGRVSLTAPAGSTEVARRELSHGDVVGIIVRERDELLTAAAEREGLGLGCDAAGLRAQAELLDAYLR